MRLTNGSILPQENKQCSLVGKKVNLIQIMHIVFIFGMLIQRYGVTLDATTICLQFVSLDQVIIGMHSKSTTYVVQLYVWLQYTANVYRGLQGLYGEIRVRGFQIYGDCMYTRNPWNFWNLHTLISIVKSAGNCCAWILWGSHVLFLLLFRMWSIQWM